MTDATERTAGPSSTADVVREGRDAARGPAEVLLDRLARITAIPHHRRAGIHANVEEVSALAARLTTAEASASANLARAELAEQREKGLREAAQVALTFLHGFSDDSASDVAEQVQDALTEATPEDGAVPAVNMLVDADWLRRKAESDPDTDCEATSPNQDSHDGR